MDTSNSNHFAKTDGEKTSSPSSTGTSDSFRIRVPTDHGDMWITHIGDPLTGMDGVEKHSLAATNLEDRAARWMAGSEDRLIKIVQKRWPKAEAA